MANVATRTEKEKMKREAREPTPFERMKELTRRVIAVPKSEINTKRNKRKRD